MDGILMSGHYRGTYIVHNRVDRFHHMIQKVPRVQASGLSVPFALDVLFHHLVVEEPQAFWHVTKITAFAPNAKVKYEVYYTACNCWRRRHRRIHF